MRTAAFHFRPALLPVALLPAGQNAPPAYAGNSAINSFASSVAASSLPGVRFVPMAAANNIVAHGAAIDRPLLNGNLNAIVLATQNWTPGGEGGISNNHAIGVWYDSAQNKRVVFNQDVAAMPAGARFNVMALNNLTAPPWSKAAFVHTATSGNTHDNRTALNHSLSNSAPPAFVFTTDNYNPGVVGGTYNNHHTGVWYTGVYDPVFPNRWAIFNQDNATMPTNTRFNVLVIVRRVCLPNVLR